MQDFIASKREAIADLCRLHHVRRLSVFGSAVRDDFDATRSDVDVIVDFDEIPVAVYANNKDDLREALATMFGRNIDLLTWESVRNPYLLQELQRSHEMLYAA